MSKPITDTLHHIGNGFFISSASDKLAELVQKVNESGKTGSIDLKISVKKIVKNGAMQITGKLKANMPADEPMEALLFATEDGTLTPDNPHQQKLNLTVVEEAPKPLKTIEANK
ncbi:hypothetical protein [Nitrosomonas sp.]|uniref:hypothetical protein n=1 Tax=Nitrosomonas sp. TaxID=42353 RepID=UPI0025F6182B|nr:hypothetical protein [Nitrosomonas sp.]